MKIPGVVVLYNPNIQEVLTYISTYTNSLDVLYVFDNSDNGQEYKKILENFSVKVIYISFNENKGIAFALNYIFEICTKANYKWILAMDQDSYFHPNDFHKYINIINDKLDRETALFSPFFRGEEGSIPQFFTSGSIINLDAWLAIGKFDHNLFIDEVDGDFTFRLSKANYSLLKIREVEINHNLGDKLCKKILGKIFCSDNHSAIRKYYIARNRIYLMKKRPEMRLIYIFDSFRKFLSFLLVETDKIKKTSMILKGVKDGFINKMGKATVK